MASLLEGYCSLITRASQAESGEFYAAPTTHLIATVEDLTDMLDYASEDIDDMDDDVDAEPSQVPPVTGHWIATSTYDVYMVDTPDNKNDEDNPSPDEDKPVDKPPKRRCQWRCQWRCSRSRRAKDSNTGTGDIETPDNAEDPKYPIEPMSKQDEREEGEYSPGHADNEDAVDINYMRESEEEVSLGDEDFIVPEEPLDQERYKS